MTKYINAKSPDNTVFSFEISHGKFSAITPQPEKIFSDVKSDSVVDLKGLLTIPAGYDVHVHSREPGLTHKEDWKSLAKSAHKGGVAGVVDMPNTIPPMMDASSVMVKAECAAASGLEFRLLLGVGASNVDNLKKLLKELSPPLCGVKVFYGQSTGDLMYSNLDKLHTSLPDDDNFKLVFHSEDQCRIDENYKKYLDKLDTTDPKDFCIHSMIRDTKAATTSTEIILEWALKSKRPVHIAHISTPREIELIEEFKARGARITSEVAPHHLSFSIEDYATLGSKIKVNPPIRSREEVNLLRTYFRQGKIDMWATDHAPHTREEKAQPLRTAPSGIPSVELFLPLLLTIGSELEMPLDKLIQMASYTPAKGFGFTDTGAIAVGNKANFCCISENDWTVKDEELNSKCGWSPFSGKTLKYKVQSTWTDGNLVYADSKA